MSLALDPVRRAGDVAVAALCRTSIVQTGARGAAIFACDKRPVALFCLRAGAIRAMALDGATMPDAEVEALCPGVLKAFEAACGAGM